MEDKQHIQLPNRKEDDEITPREQLIYIAIKSFMNKDTKEAFPSLKKLSEMVGASIPTIRSAIKRLQELDYIKVIKIGRSQIYKFNSYKNFEPFSYEFLNNKDLSFMEKSYITATQQYMFKNGDTGSISYTNRELSEKINMPESTISKCNRELESKHFLTIVNNKSKDLETGLDTQTKIFHLAEFGQAIVGVLNSHESRLDQNENDIAQLKKQNELLLNEINRLRNEMKKEEPIIL